MNNSLNSTAKPYNYTCKNTMGGRTTNSPPAKISSLDSASLKILSSNIDTIKLSVDVVWTDPGFFAMLTDGKEFAKSNKDQFPIPFQINESQDDYIFNIKSFGSQGYEWILLNGEFSLLIGNWESPQAKPSVIISIRSETLWRKGPLSSIIFILDFLKSAGGELKEPKISRLDLCVDTLFPASLWTSGLLDFRVTRAAGTEIYHSHDKLSGFTIGKGKIKARIYDKALEIKQVSNKTWFYPIWGFKTVPEGFKIIRVEFQLYREIMKELGIDTLNGLFKIIQNLWSYCTKKWLKFQTNPGKQSHQRKTYEWWAQLQNGFNELNAGTPLIRCKALNAEKNALSQQILGLLSSFAALESESHFQDKADNPNLRAAFELFLQNSMENNLHDISFFERVEGKRAKYQRTDEKLLESLKLRKEFGLI